MKTNIGRFKRGIPSWNKGKHHTEEAKEKNRLAHIGKRVSPKTEFKKGSIPWNKGIKGLHPSPATEFKKGQKGINWLPVGSIKTRTDWHSKHHSNRKWIKISEPNKWVLLAINRWTQKNGNIPKGMLVHHKDSDCLNDNLNNLKLVTRTEHINIHRKLLESFNPKFNFGAHKK